MLVNGCCNVNAPSSRQYICKTCLANGCCNIYEYCVSCCLQPDKVPSLLSLHLTGKKKNGMCHNKERVTFLFSKVVGNM